MVQLVPETGFSLLANRHRRLHGPVKKMALQENEVSSAQAKFDEPPARQIFLLDPVSL